jgi:hypothetical protein
VSKEDNLGDGFEGILVGNCDVIFSHIPCLFFLSPFLQRVRFGFGTLIESCVGCADKWSDMDCFLVVEFSGFFSQIPNLFFRSTFLHLFWLYS